MSYHQKQQQQATTTEDLMREAEQIARKSKGETKYQVFARLLRENPEVYENYLAVEQPAFRARVARMYPGRISA